MANFIYPHIAITVNDIKKTKEFYRAIGFRIKEDIYSQEKKRHFLLLEGYGFEMEVFYFDDQAKGQRSIEDLKKVNIHHFGVPIKNIEKIKKELIKKNIPLYKDIQTSSLGLKYLNIQDPSGFIFEFFEIPVK